MIDYSLRSSGKASGGAVAKGGAGSKVGTTPTIPSKYETLLNVGARENDGFLNRCHRFKEHENDLPGPGNYHKGAPTYQERESFSKKGLGGFASASKRFTGQVYHPSVFNPGPGQYGAGHTEFIQKKNFSKITSSSSMAPRIVNSAPVTMRVAKAPGPGEYNLSGTLGAGPAPAAAGFKSTAERFKHKMDEMPAPGQYEAKTIEDFPKGAADALPQGVFRSNTIRDTTGVAGRNAYKPGPGAYDVPSDGVDAAYKGRAKVQTSSSFAKGATDRFGNYSDPRAKAERKKKKKFVQMPGPGAYDPILDVEYVRMPDMSSSFFASAHDRFPNKLKGKPPGPAFYNPNPLAHKRSFHLNAHGKFV
eukprot:GFYU01011590.1.p1 GENE.GFYU01011590.1~~GFYU01011590.1.p1  ORF type:complete len:361 (-),score=68.96 GFYU01011590.1:235-1317(-)